ncbi:MAG: hypothetical protein LBU21_00135 [Treponema sp.]|nr:hypothetical protein [Treponema sp.]
MSSDSADVPKGSPPRPNCLRCAYFKVTWDPAFPRSCALFNLKCRNLPSIEVFLATGRRCPSFLPKRGIG